jgi:hypothetical protein
MPNQSLKQTGRANATVEHFSFAGVFRDSIVFWSVPSGSLALRSARNEKRIKREINCTLAIPSCYVGAVWILPCGIPDGPDDHSYTP